MASALGSQDLPQAGVRILFGPSFAVFDPCFLHDRLLSYALRLGGAEITPTYCDAVQALECNVSGGVWQESNFAQVCGTCTKRSRLLWAKNVSTPLAFSRYLTPQDLAEADAIGRSLGPHEWTDFVADGMPLGAWARDILVNNYVVGDYRRVPEFATLGPMHVRNLVVLKTAYNRLLDDLQPDRIICNDSYYGMWAILQTLAARRDIPFYSHWMGGRKRAWCYAYGDAAMNLDFSKAWPAFSAMSMSKEQSDRVQTWLDSRFQGGDMIFDTASLAAHQREQPQLAALNSRKPTAILPANIVWDLAALNRQLVFPDMMAWIRRTIEWFGEHQQYQLIVKAHPGELNPAIPATEERVEVALGPLGEALPPNVALLGPTARVTIYDLLPLATVGLVHTTTVGIEMAARGIPVITTARSPYRGFGFTLDAADEHEYFGLIEEVLAREGQQSAQAQTDAARKFILFHYFHYYTRTDLIDFTWGQRAKLLVSSLEDLEPGRNRHLDYVVDSILQGLPIIGPNRWPAMS